MSTSIHVVVSVDIDRFSDRQLRRDWCRVFTADDGSRCTPIDIRNACARQRAAGLTCFPNPDCDNRKPTGECAGHQEPNEEALVPT